MRHKRFERLLPAVCKIAVAAGEAILHIYDQAGAAGAPPLEVVFKDDASPLTLADLASHRIIAAALAKLEPELPVVSEEGDQGNRRSTGAFWLVDPLDGTKEFIARNGEFTVNIALIIDGAPVFGVVYAPALSELYWGGREFGSFLTVGEEEFHLPTMLQRPPKIRVVASKSHLNTETREFIEKLGEVELIQAGSSLKFCRVAEGRADVYPRLAPTAEWDTAAAQAVLEGAGGYVHDLAGGNLHYGKPDVLNPSFIAASQAFQGGGIC